MFKETQIEQLNKSFEKAKPSEIIQKAFELSRQAVINTNENLEKVPATLTKSKEKISRTLVKTVVWMFIGTLDTLILSWYFTGHIKFALTITAVEFISKSILYFFYGRSWNLIKWGK